MKHHFSKSIKTIRRLNRKFPRHICHSWKFNGDGKLVNNLRNWEYEVNNATYNYTSGTLEILQSIVRNDTDEIGSLENSLFANLTGSPEPIKTLPSEPAG